ncbi:MAG: DUF2336 domain-containing protein [Hyphomicrobiales bacterium]
MDRVARIADAVNTSASSEGSDLNAKTEGPGSEGQGLSADAFRSLAQKLNPRPAAPPQAPPPPPASTPPAPPVVSAPTSVPTVDPAATQGIGRWMALAQKARGAAHQASPPPESTAPNPPDVQSHVLPPPTAPPMPVAAEIDRNTEPIPAEEFPAHRMQDLEAVSSPAEEPSLAFEEPATAEQHATVPLEAALPKLQGMEASTADDSATAAQEDALPEPTRVNAPDPALEGSPPAERVTDSSIERDSLDEGPLASGFVPASPPSPDVSSQIPLPEADVDSIDDAPVDEPAIAFAPDESADALADTAANAAADPHDEEPAIEAVPLDAATIAAEDLDYSSAKPDERSHQTSSTDLASDEPETVSAHTEEAFLPDDLVVPVAADAVPPANTLPADAARNPRPDEDALETVASLIGEAEASELAPAAHPVPADASIVDRPVAEVLPDTFADQREAQAEPASTVVPADPEPLTAQQPEPEIEADPESTPEPQPELPIDRLRLAVRNAAPRWIEAAPSTWGTAEPAPRTVATPFRPMPGQREAAARLPEVELFTPPSPPAVTVEVAMPFQPSVRLTPLSRPEPVPAPRLPKDEPSPAFGTARRAAPQPTAEEIVPFTLRRPANEADDGRRSTPARIESQAEDATRVILDIITLSGSTALPQERSLAVDALVELLPALPVEQLRAISARIAIMETPPPQVVSFLVRYADADVAAPIIETCSALTDPDLLGLIEEGNGTVLRMIARRRSVSSTVSARLAETGKGPVQLALVRNAGAAISAETFATLCRFARANPALHAPIATRPDLPPMVAFELFWWVEADLRRYLMTRFLVDTAAIGRILRILSNAPGQIGFAYPDERDVESFVDLLAGGQIGFATECLAGLLRIRQRTAKRMIEDPEGEALAVALKLLGMNRALAAKTMTVLSKADNAPLRSDRDTQELQSIFDSLSTNKARVLVTYWDWASSLAAEDETKSNWNSD